MATPQQKDNALKELHFQLHIARMQATKPTATELKFSYIISNLYKDECSECNQVVERKKQEAENIIKGNVTTQKSFLDKILGK
jgi:hypothetical protein